MRQFLKSSQLVDFLNKNEHLELEVSLKRGSHPYISATYINGYIKDNALRKKEWNEVLDEF